MYEAVKSNIPHRAAHGTEAFQPPLRAAGPVASALRARHQAMVTSCTIIIRISKALEKVTICPLTRTECAIYLVLHSKKLPSARSRARSALSTWFCTRKSYHLPRGGGWKPPFHGLTQCPSALLQTSHPLRPPNKPPALSAPPPLSVSPPALPPPLRPLREPPNPPLRPLPLGHSA